MNDQQQAELLRALAKGKTVAEFLEAEGLDMTSLKDVRWNAEDVIVILREVEKRSAPTPIQGIDTSTFQGTPDFQRVQTGGIHFVIARAGFGTGNTDRQFHRTAGECNRLGLPLGTYWFSYALNTSDAVREARSCLETVRPYQLEYPIFYDFEYDSIRYAEQNGVIVTRDLATEIVSAFCREIEAAGYYAAFYTNADFSRNMLNMSALSRFDLWYAWYQSSLNRDRVGMWQYSSTGRVQGITGDVDLDVSLRNYPVIIRQAGLNGLSPLPDTEDDGFPDGTQAWQKEGFQALVENGIINSPAFWKERFAEPMTVGQVLGVMGRLV